jgi:glycosyltransferase involved in cell wall biosynthesis
MHSLLIISLETEYGGAERSIEIAAEALQRDVRVTVLAFAAKHVDALQKLLRPPSRVITWRRFGGDLDGRLPLAALVVRLAALRPDAVLVNTHLSARILAAAARVLPGISRRTFIYVRDFMWSDLDLILDRLSKSRILISGPALLDRPDYLSHHLAPHGPMRWSVVANAVRLPAPASRPETSAGYVLHLATANLWKGHYPLIRAAAALRDRGTQMRFISRGQVDDPAYWAALHRIVRNWGLAGSFALWDFVDDPSELLRGSLCVVVPSVSHFGGPESFGRTIIEAWAHAKPVVAFDAGGAHHLIEHERDGLLVPEGDVEALADALQRLQQNPDLCRHLGENGLAKVHGRSPWRRSWPSCARYSVCEGM